MTTSLSEVLSRPLLPAVLLGATLLGGAAGVSAESDPVVVDEGKKIAFDRRKGNCLACHMMDDGVSPGNIGPPLVAMKARFPDRNDLHTQVWDATVKNPESIMPPFGRHQVLTEEELNKVVEYIWTL